MQGSVKNNNQFLRGKVDNICYVMLSIFSINVETLKTGLSSPNNVKYLAQFLY